MELLQTKSLLAKLMATENIIVEQRNVETAAFDIKNRILILPNLDKNISGYLYDLLVSHEVGHALYTPQDGLTKAFDLKLDMGIMNVLEDSRIERKIKNKYPGVRASFVRGYKELIEKDFFGTAGADLNELNFIDRVNLFCKGGPAQGIKFNEVETALVNAIESTVTYDDVINLAVSIGKYMEEEQERKKVLVQDDEGTEEFDNHGYDDSKENEDSGEDHYENDSVEDNTETKDGETLSETLKSGPGAGDEKSLSKTDEAFRENQKRLYDNSSSNQYYYGNIPDFDVNKMIVPYKTLWNRYKETCIQYDYMGVDNDSFKKVKQDSTKVVSYLAKEFELRKNADQMKRATIAKTGDLNLSKIYSYKFNEDLFKKATVVPNGKSHGLVMFLDWSGSMSENLEGTVKQLINLSLFCRKVIIPFEVYAFSSEYGENDWLKDTEVEGNIYMHKCNLLNILSSKMSAAEFSYACSAMLAICNRYTRPEFMALGGTPLDETIIAALKIVPAFKKQYKLQIVNTVFLTDGEGQSTYGVYETHTNSAGKPFLAREYPNGKMIIRDKKTMIQEISDERHKQTPALLRMLKQIAGCNVVGFFILNGRDFKSAMYRYGPRSIDMDLARAQFRKNNYHVLTNAGYDEYYLIRAEGMDTDEDEGFTVKENATTRSLVSAFNKYTNGRLNSRVVLNRFIGVIA